jgi:protein-S-isoprenylcysteine O-methyltransferase Ste14
MLLSILILALFFIFYAVAHSLLASLSLKNWARRAFGPTADRWYRLVYNLLAGLTLLPLLPLLALLPDQILYIVPAPWRWLMLGGQVLALVGLGIAFLQSAPFYFVGLAQLLVPEPPRTGQLLITGLHRWMRHPLYTFSLLLIWLTPAMSVNLLVTYILFTLYFYIGSIHEESRLVAEFGPTYREYQHRVPRFGLIEIPYHCLLSLIARFYHRPKNKSR